MQRKILKVVGWMLLISAVVIVIYRRIVGIDSTEGQLLIQDFPWWILVAGCVVGGIAIINNAKGS